MGGAIALSLANLCQDRLRAIILNEANLDAGGGFISKKIALYDEQEYLLRGHKEIIYENIKKGTNQNWVASFSMSNPIAIFRESKSLVEGQTPSWRDILYSLPIPRTFIFGEKSLPDPEFKILKNNNIHIEIVKEAGHFMASENPEGLAIAIKNGIND
jgi:pimeloyl-ACP methyl ester carboxylesterase